MIEKNARPRGLRVVAALALALTCALGLTALSPTRALAAEAVAYVYDADGNKVDYDSIYDAMTAGYGKTIYLTADIEVKKAITIPRDKTATLDMMGHTVKNATSDARTFELSVNSKLTITSSVTKEITFTGYGSDGKEKEVTVTTGGLICGAYGFYSGGAIYASTGSTLTLKNVTVGGNRAYATSEGGGAAIAVNTWGIVNLEDNTQITANYSSNKGGAILSLGDGVDIVIDKSSITGNTSVSGGGAIMVEGDKTDITMRNGAKIANNAGGASGGAVDFAGCDFELSCNDGSATISENHARYGGAVNAVVTSGFSEGGTISGITFSGNSAYYQGGAMFIRQNNVTVENCTITGSEATVEDGGGIYIHAKNDTVKNCTITDNTCYREGGGIFVYYRYDLYVDGVLKVENNTREDGAADDVFLDSTSANNIWAYLRGNLGEGSSVGFRTGVTGDRRVMKDLTNYIEGTVFMDMDGYRPGYSSSDSELWQRTGAYDYLVTLNGKNVRRFARGATVTIDGSSSDSSTFFCRWDTDASKGITGGISETDKYKEQLTFTMPQNEVHLVGVYASPLESASLRVFSKPVAGKTLPTFASFRWKNSTLSSDGEQQRDVPLTWYEVAADGTMTQASGVAKAGTTYVASFSIAADPTMARVFSTSMADDAVTIYATDKSQEKSASTSVDKATGTLTVTTGKFTTEGDAPAEAGGTITVKLVGADLPVGASEQAMLLADVADDADEDLIGEVTVSYAEGSDSVTIAAPEEGGWNFCNWERTSSACSYDDELGKVVVNDLTQVSELTATYTPVVTEAAVGLDAPVAGATLPSSVSELTATCSDGTTFDLVKTFSSDDTLPVSWSSAGESVTAQPSTTYTALIELEDGEGIADVEKVMSPNAIVTANGTKVSSAGFVVLNNTLYLSVTFPETGSAKLAEVAKPDAIELTFDEAKACQAQQDAAEGDLCWPLPKSCGITLEGGQTIACDVTWDVPTGFDAGATGAQQLVATGRLSLPSYIDQNGVSLDVTCAIKVASPDGGHDKGDDDDDKEDDDEHGKGDEKGDEDKDATKPDPNKGNKALPQTGDTNSTATVVALGAAGVAVIAAALVLRRRKK